MNLFQKTARALGGYLLRSSGALRDPALISLFGGTPNESGVSVTEATVLGFSPVSSAIQQIATGIAKLPLCVFRQQGKHADRAPDHSVYGLLHDRPNPRSTSINWRENFFKTALVSGNACAEIERDPLTARPIALHHLRPEWTQPYLDEQGKFWIIYRDPNHGDARIPYCDVLHLRGLGDDFWGASPIKQHKISIGTGMAAERFGARFFGRGAHPTGVIKHPKELSKEAATRMQADFERLHSGLSNSHRVAILEEGSEFVPFSHPPEDAQYIESRKFSVEEVARIYNIPPHKLRDLTNANNSTLERENTNFLVETLMPWMIRFEQEANYKLLAPHERGSFFVSHVFEGLLRAEQSVRFAAYAVGINWGILSPNECRAKENLPPRPGGDIFLQPLNMQPIGAQIGGAMAPASSPSSGLAPTEPAGQNSGLLGESPEDSETERLLRFVQTQFEKNPDFLKLLEASR